MIVVLSIFKQPKNIAKWATTLAWLLTSFAAHAISECEGTHCQQGTAGEFEMILADGSRRPALLLDTQVVGEIAGMIASISLVQSFKNDTNEWLSGRYVFPLPEGAAIDNLKIRIGERVINGVIQEKVQAQKTFQEAKKAGKKASLLKQHRPNLFSISIANIAPQETILVHIHYVDTVQYENQTFSMRFPTTLTPRYIAGAPLPLNSEPIAREVHGLDVQESSAFIRESSTLAKESSTLAKESSTFVKESSTFVKEPSTLIKQASTFVKNNPASTVNINPKTGWAANTTSVPDAQQITPPQVHYKFGRPSNLFSFKLTIEAGLPLNSVSSSSHSITSETTQTGNNKNAVYVSLANSHEPMDSDLLLHWQPAIGTAPQAALFKQSLKPSPKKISTDHYTMLMVTPPANGVSQNLPRDITFIIDSSGSMAGSSMQQAKQSLLQGLQYLSSYDKFNVVDFDSEYRPLFRQSRPATLANLEKAKYMINYLSADGGTQMSSALDFSLSQATHESYLRQIIFITDGSIGNETELFNLINKKLGSARLFTIGIGSAPNTHFMTKAASFGRGSFTYINDLNQVNHKIQALFKKIKQAKLRNIKIDWPTEVEQYPNRIPDLYAGEPILVIAKSTQAIETVSLSGQLSDRRWQETISDPSTKNPLTQSKNLDTLWARHKIQALSSDFHDLIQAPDAANEIKNNIIELGIAHQLVTKFTSFVAVEQRISRPQNTPEKHENIANLMPKGSAMAAPTTATAQDFFLIIGSLLSLLSCLLPLIRKRTHKGFYQATQGCR